MKSDLVDVEVFVFHETEKAWLLWTDEDRGKAVWLPKSQCEIERIGRTVAMATMPERTAHEKGLI